MLHNLIQICRKEEKNKFMRIKTEKNLGKAFVVSRKKGHQL
jgi:hypothetical protein